MTWAIRDWLVWAEPFGLGELALVPDQFWRLTYREFKLMRDGFFRRQDRLWEMVGTLGVWIIAPYSKQSYTPAKLLGRTKLVTLPPGPQRDPTPAEIEAEKARVLHDALKWARS